MNVRSLCILFLLMGSPSLCISQNSAKVKALKQEKSKVQKQMKKKQSELEDTRKTVDEKLKSITFLGVQLESRLKYIAEMEKKMEAVDQRIISLERQISEAENELEVVKERYKKSLLYARTHRAVQSPLLFIFSAENLTQMFRRARYAQEYADFQGALGKQIQNKQKALLNKKGELLQAKAEMSQLVQETMQQRKKLIEEQKQQELAVKELQKHEKELMEQVRKHQKEISALDDKIDAVIAEEIERARQKALAEAERKRKLAAQEAAKKKGSKTSKSSKQKSTKSKDKDDLASAAWRTPVDQVLSANFEKNKGRLPVPITGSYMISGHFGKYNVPGLRNVQLDNKGTNFVGKKNARARAIFDGEVTAVFQYGGAYNVLIRHGKYISVYCNLSSVIVRNGQKVKTKDLIGAIAEDEAGRCNLHFQLRKERVKLNPEIWISR